MKKVFSYIKIIAVNLIVFIGLVLFLNFLSAAYIDFRQVKNTVSGARQDRRASLPAYEEKSYPQAVFRDFEKMESHYKPYVGWQLTPLETQTLHIDKDGRRFVPRQAQMSQKQTVHFFGGSTMFGTGVHDQDTIPAKVESKLDSVHSINHGVSGYVSRQSLAALINLFNSNEKVDVVVFYDGVNDVINLCREDNLSINSHSHEMKLKSLMEKDRKEKEKPRLVQFFTSDTLELTKRINRKFFKNETGEKDGFQIPSRCQDNPELMRTLVQTMLRNWELAHAVAVSENVEFIAVLQPVAYVGEPYIPYLYLDEAWRDEYREMYSYWKTAIKQKRYDWVIDATDAFDIEEPIYIDWAHVNAKGNGIIAELIADRVKTLLKERK